MYKYFAFISYSHKNIKYARKLQEKLEFYGLNSVIQEIHRGDGFLKKYDGKLMKMLDNKDRADAVYLNKKGERSKLNITVLDLIKDLLRTKISKKKIKFYPMCRDECEFTAGGLNEEIKNYLKASRKLIVLCSKHSIGYNDSEDYKGSEYVFQEIANFIEKDNGKFENVIFVNVEDDKEVLNKITSVIKNKFNKDIQFVNDDELIGTTANNSENKSDDDVQLMINGKEKDCHLRIIAAMLGVAYSFVKDREKVRRRKLLTKQIIALSVVAVAILWLSFGALINNNINKAIQSDILEEKIELLIKTNEIANTTLHSNEKILETLNSFLDIQSGTLLKSDRISNDYYRAANYGTNVDKRFFIMHAKDNDEDVVFDSVLGKEIARYNYNDGILKYYFGEKWHEVEMESAAQGSIIEFDEKHCVIHTNNMVAGTEKSQEFDFKSKEKKIVDLSESLENINDNKENSYKKINSPDDSYQFEFFEKGFMCLDKSTNETTYTIETNSDMILFSENGVAIVGTEGDSKTNCEFICFNVQSGNILRKINSYSVPAFDISGDGKYIAYSLDDSIIVENISTKETFSIGKDNAIIGCKFRYNSSMIWTFTTRGEFDLWAVDSIGDITDNYRSVMFDVNNNKVCWLSDGNSTYEYDYLNNTLKLLINEGVSFVGQTSEEVKIEIMTPESKLPLIRWINKKTGEVRKDTDGALIEETYDEEKEIINDAISKLGKIINPEGYDVKPKFIQISNNGKYMASYEETIINNSHRYNFKVYNIDKKEIVFEKALKGDKFYPKQGIEYRGSVVPMPIFNDKNDKFLLCYEDQSELKIKTDIYDISGNLLSTYDGVPYYHKGMDKYWNNKITFVCSNFIQTVNVATSEKQTLEKAYTMLQYIDSGNSNDNLLKISSNDDVVEHNSNKSLYQLKESTPRIEVKQIDLNENIDINSIVQLAQGVNLAVEVFDENGIYETKYWFDNDNEQSYDVNRLETFVPVIPVEFKDNKIHTIHIQTESASRTKTRIDLKFVFRE